jgi:uncharacterized membrane-anchored protein YjiN (DUF445 family)
MIRRRQFTTPSPTPPRTTSTPDPTADAGKDAGNKDKTPPTKEEPLTEDEIATQKEFEEWLDELINKVENSSENDSIVESADDKTQGSLGEDKLPLPTFHSYPWKDLLKEYLTVEQKGAEFHSAIAILPDAQLVALYHLLRTDLSIAMMSTDPATVDKATKIMSKLQAAASKASKGK